MPRVLASIAACCLLFVSPMLGDNAPRVLTVEPALVEFGRVAQHQTLTSTVLLLNRGEIPIEILSVNADCGCTTSKLETSTLAPGGSTALMVRFETRQYSGSIQRRLQIVTNAGIQILPVHANVVPYEDWEITPVPAILPPSLPGQAAKGDVTVLFRGEGAARVIEASCNFAWLKPELTASPSGGYIVKLQKQPDAPAGTHSAVLMLRTDRPEVPLLTLPVLVPVASELSAVPHPVIFPTTRLGEEGSAMFRVLGWKGDEPPTASVTRGTVRYVGASNGEHTFEVRWTPEAQGSAIASVQILRGAQVELEIPVVARVE